MHLLLKFIYSEKAKKFCKISTLLLTGTTEDKSKMEISQNFVAFSEYMNFKNLVKLIGVVPDERGPDDNYQKIKIKRA